MLIAFLTAPANCFKLNGIAKKIVELVKRRKKIDVKVAYVKENLIVFVKALISNPSFDSQTKETLTTPVSKFGSRCEVPDRFVEAAKAVGAPMTAPPV